MHSLIIAVIILIIIIVVILYCVYGRPAKLYAISVGGLNNDSASNGLLTIKDNKLVPIEHGIGPIPTTAKIWHLDPKNNVIYTKTPNGTMSITHVKNADGSTGAILTPYTPGGSAENKVVYTKTSNGAMTITQTANGRDSVLTPYTLVDSTINKVVYDTKSDERTAKLYAISVGGLNNDVTKYGLLTIKDNRLTPILYGIGPIPTNAKIWHLDLTNKVIYTTTSRGTMAITQVDNANGTASAILTPYTPGGSAENKLVFDTKPDGKSYIHIVKDGKILNWCLFAGYLGGDASFYYCNSIATLI